MDVFEIMIANPQNIVNAKKKFDNFCQNDQHCTDIGDEYFSTCEKSGVNHGKCIKVTHQKSNFDMLQAEQIPVPIISKEDYENIPKPQLDLVSSGGCGNEFMDPPEVNATTKIAEVTYDVNVKFSSVGIEFISTVSLYPCSFEYNGTTLSYAHFDQNGIYSAGSAVKRERGNNFQNDGALVLVAGLPNDNSLNGWMYFPSSGTLAGVGFMHHRVIAAGFTTLAHELGHGFGLYHTFHGISEVPPCSTCYEYGSGSDVTGDLYADTPPVVVNFACSSPLDASESGYPEPCNTTGRTSWNPNPYTNLMSYGNCRNSFTECQKRRIRCYNVEKLAWLTALTVCFGKESSDSTVCSGQSTCTGKDTCSCTGGFSGSQCQIPPGQPSPSPQPTPSPTESPKVSPIPSPSPNPILCYGKPQNDPNVCSGQGTCTNTDSCSCENGYTGDQCQNPPPINSPTQSPSPTFTCFGISSSDSNVCSGNGQCVSQDQCNCNSGYGGQKCGQIFCFGISNTDSSVCSGNGQCTGPNTYQCNTNYVGSTCSSAICFGKQGSQSCFGHGSCLKPDVCTCSPGYFGNECGTVKCFEKASTDGNVCSSKGKCVSPNVCACNTGFSGLECDLSQCRLTENGVCNSQGSCVGENTCQCNTGYFGTACEINSCYNKTDSLTVCSGHGKCTGLDQCECDQGYSGAKCENTKCFNILSTSSSVCSGNGKCIELDKCLCNVGHADEECDQIGCFGKLPNDFDVCNGRGNCTLGQCSCYSNYTGNECETTTCFGVSSSDTSVCSGNGKCVYVDKCQCKDGYVGEKCKTETCYGLISTDPKVCSGNGQCTGANTCTCNSGFKGTECEARECYGILSSSSLVCSGNRKCTNTDQCTCDKGYSGDNCDRFTCEGKVISNPTVCSGNGKCIGNDKCSCDYGYGGSNCDKFACDGYITNTTNACNGRGHCVKPNTCICNFEYSGSFCEVSICFGISSTNKTTCSSHGTCIEKDKCNCNYGYIGTKCDVIDSSLFKGQNSASPTSISISIFIVSLILLLI
eukprot:gene4934-8531_t